MLPLHRAVCCRAEGRLTSAFHLKLFFLCERLLLISFIYKMENLRQLRNRKHTEITSVYSPSPPGTYISHTSPRTCAHRNTYITHTKFIRAQTCNMDPHQQMLTHALIIHIVTHDSHMCNHRDLSSSQIHSSILHQHIVSISIWVHSCRTLLYFYFHNEKWSSGTITSHMLKITGKWETSLFLSFNVLSS